MITYENLRQFCYTNDQLIKTPIKGICLNFFGLGNTSMFWEDSERAVKFADAGIIYVQPYLNPWAWMNKQAVEITDKIVTVLAEHYGLGDVAVCSTGGSMGGMSCLVYARYSGHHIVACVANCPVCDMPYHITERVDLPRTIYSAYYDYEDFDQALKDHSPLHLVPTMPRVPYHIFHCEEDMAVNIDKHSARFVAAMREAGFEVTYDTVPEAGHCKLTPEAWEKFDQFIIAELSK
ncbi:MAG: prolyl oligopeptidase family serine peptidase [Clostridia bacterium]|nr:prolyl oligopeptidase family serine peptidase [Clostridia bacterium]